MRPISRRTAASSFWRGYAATPCSAPYRALTKLSARARVSAGRGRRPSQRPRPHGGFRPLDAEHTVFDAPPGDPTGPRRGRQPAQALVEGEPALASQSCGLTGMGRLRSASATAGADSSSAFRMSP